MSDAVDRLRFVGRGRYRKRVERAGNAFEFGDQGRRKNMRRACFRANVTFGEVALGEAGEADADLRGLCT